MGLSTTQAGRDWMMATSLVMLGHAIKAFVRSYENDASNLDPREGRLNLRLSRGDTQGSGRV